MYSVPTVTQNLHKLIASFLCLLGRASLSPGWHFSYFGTLSQYLLTMWRWNYLQLISVHLGRLNVGLGPNILIGRSYRRCAGSHSLILDFECPKNAWLFCLLVWDTFFFCHYLFVWGTQLWLCQKTLGGHNGIWKVTTSYFSWDTLLTLLPSFLPAGQGLGLLWEYHCFFL